MIPQAILFDLDGTLLDTLGDIATAANAALAELGQPTHPTAAFRDMVGAGADVLMQQALGADRAELVERGLAAFKSHYRLHLTDQTRPYDGVTDVLDHMVTRGVPGAVLTNKPQAAAERVVAALLDRFPWAAIVGQRPGVPRKPDPTAALRIAADLGVEPGRCLFVGDSHIDMHTASAAGMTGIGAAWGFRSRRELTESGAVRVVEQPRDLLELLG
ncbi:MAG: HAD family hydrolase [Phycisphaerae bacterium]|nr:HAD family hydrolase [Phycisphaerae bacterium]